MRPPAFIVQSVKFDRLCNAAQCTKAHVRTAFCVSHGISSGTSKIALEHGIVQVEEHTWRQRHLLPVGMHHSLQPRVPQRRRRKRLVRIVVACAQSSIAGFETLKTCWVTSLSATISHKPANVLKQERALARSHLLRWPCPKPQDCPPSAAAAEVQWRCQSRADRAAPSCASRAAWPAPCRPPILPGTSGAHLPPPARLRGCDMLFSARLQVESDRLPAKQL